MTASVAQRHRRRLYLDSSAYLALLLDEVAARDLVADTASAEILSSVLLILETKRNLLRFARERALRAEHYHACMDRVEQDAALFTLRDVTLDLCNAIATPAVTTPRSLDLVHVRTALWFHAQQKIDRFVTLDLAQEAAAKELGLPV